MNKTEMFLSVRTPDEIWHKYIRKIMSNFVLFHPNIYKSQYNVNVKFSHNVYD